jgi:hypothetical protein
MLICTSAAISSTRVSGGPTMTREYTRYLVMLIVILPIGAEVDVIGGELAATPLQWAAR